MTIERPGVHYTDIAILPTPMAVRSLRYDFISLVPKMDCFCHARLHLILFEVALGRVPRVGMPNNSAPTPRQLKNIPLIVESKASIFTKA